MLWEVVVSWKSQRFNKNDLAKIPRFHADHKLWTNGSYFLKDMLVSVGFTYVFAFSKFLRFAKIPNTYLGLL